MKPRVMHVNLASGGIGHYGLLWGRALARVSSVETLSVFANGWGTSRLWREQIEQVEHVAVPVGRLTEKAASLWEIRRLIKRFRPDVVHDTAGSAMSYGIALWPVVRRYADLWVTEHDPVPHPGHGNLLRNRLTRRLLRRAATQIVVHGSACKRMLVNDGFPDARVTSIHHGNYGVFGNPSSGTKRQKNSVLFFGELRPNKGVEWLLPIADIVSKAVPDVQFVVAGSNRFYKDLQQSPWPGQLAQILERMRAREHFQVRVEYIPDEEVGDYFQRSDISLLPYHSGTQSGIAMIAMALGSVVVATRVGDVAEVVRDGETGYLAETTVESVSATVVRALREHDKTDAIRERARAFALGDCSWDRIVGQVLTETL